VTHDDVLLISSDANSLYFIRKKSLLADEVKLFKFFGIYDLVHLNPVVLSRDDHLSFTDIRPLNLKIRCLLQREVMSPHRSIRLLREDAVLVDIVSDVVNTDKHEILADQRDMRDGSRLKQFFLSTEKVILQIICPDRVVWRHQLGHKRFVEYFGYLLKLQKCPRLEKAEAVEHNLWMVLEDFLFDLEHVVVFSHLDEGGKQLLLVGELRFIRQVEHLYTS
jgi:hypothetical protein